MTAEYWSGVKPITEPFKLEPLRTELGQTVEDITVGFSAVPEDVQHRIRFFKANTPYIPELSIPINQRASFRYVTAPGMEIKLGPGEKLLWEVTDVYGWSHHQVEAPMPDVWTKGRDMRNGRVIVNQSVYTDTV